ncbi:MAG TPA: iron uptake transporter permease EfeU [Gryllotalpicola sp.]
MLATLVIGLREGLEAALIVGIIAAFLRTNRKSLTPMWIGVAAAVALSIGVGIALSVIERSLPQAAQEGMESVIGAVAVVFVTGMIVWMNTHSRGLKRELEAEASEAINDGHAYALAGMAFLAVLKEGFETSVFLLATFTASSNTLLAAAGAVIGVLAAIAIGIGIYAGSIRLNLSTFFRATGVFLILVAAGLVLTTLRTAHEAGWLNAGQQRALNLDWLVAPGTVQSSLITGVLGIPADPRLIEIIGWLAYLVPVALFVYWPHARRAKGMQIARVQFGIGGAVALVAIGLAAFVPRVEAPQASTAQIAASTPGTADAAGTARLDGDALVYALGGQSVKTALDPERAKQVDHDGIPARHWSLPIAPAATAPTTLTLTELMALNDDRIPVGISPAQNPGPFTARWTFAGGLDVWTSGGVLLDAQQTARTAVTLSGGGLATPRTISVDAPQYAPSSWAMTDGAAQSAANALGAAASARTERSLWAVQLPIALGIAALLLAVFGLRSRRRALRPSTTPQNPTSSPASPATPQRSHSYAAH